MAPAVKQKNVDKRRAANAKLSGAINRNGFGDDIWFEIASKMDPKTLLHFSRSTKRFRDGLLLSRRNRAI